MGNFGKRGKAPARGRFGGGRKFNGGRPERGGRGRMYQAVCDECGNACEVPFKPTGDKPVYCNNCFKGKGMSREDNSRREQRSSFGDKPMFSATCDECGNACEVPFRPSSGKPVYCSDCFEKNKGNKGGRSGGQDNLAQQFLELNAKLDKILNVLTSQQSPEKPAKEIKKVKKAAVKKPATKKKK